MRRDFRFFRTSHFALRTSTTMIALLAAVAEETHLIRTALEGIQRRTVHGVAIMTGTLFQHDVCLAHSGIGKAAAAATAVSVLSSCRPQALWLFGCGGAYPASGLEIGDLALAEAEIFADEGVDTGTGFRDLAAMRLPMRPDSGAFYNHWPVDRALYSWARPLCETQAQTTAGKLASGPFATVSTCTGTSAAAEAIARRTGAICENMEGAAVALACQQLGVPLLEVRGIANRVEDYDPAKWDLAAGMNAAQSAILALLPLWPGACP